MTVFTVLREEKLSKGDIAKDIRVSREEVEQLVFGLTIVGLGGAGSLAGSISRQRNHLRVVGSNE
jgi:hypothetical protein